MDKAHKAGSGGKGTSQGTEDMQQQTEDDEAQGNTAQKIKGHGTRCRKQGNMEQYTSYREQGTSLETRHKPQRAGDSRQGAMDNEQRTPVEKEQ